MDLRRIYTPPPPRQFNASSGDRADGRGARLRAGPPPRERVHGFIPAPQRLTAPLSLHGGGVLTSDTMRAAGYGVGSPVLPLPAFPDTGEPLSEAGEALEEAEAAAAPPAPEGPSASAFAALLLLGLVAYAWAGA